MNRSYPAIAILASLVICTLVIGASAPQPKLAIRYDANRGLEYSADAQGNRVPDFSYAGYMRGQVPIPNVPVRVVVSPAPGDNTARIQAAIDYVSTLKLDNNGIRGAVLLEKGRYEISGGITIDQSGVVLRGRGPGVDGTLLVATGDDRRTLITVKGNDDRKFDEPVAIADQYVPVNATKLRVANASRFKPGDTIAVRRPCTADWIKALGMNDTGGGIGLGWKPNTRDIIWDRVVTAIAGNELTLDAPITTAIDATYGGGTVAVYVWPERITQVGVENLACESVCDPNNPKDEAHSWIAITLQNVQNAWVRRIKVTHFVGSAVSVFDAASQITVEDCRSLAPVSEIAGYRRHTFFTSGQLTLFKACWSEHGRHDFSVGCCAAGPNAFVQCQAIDALDDSGSIDSWASGVLFDNVRIDGNALNLGNRGYADQFVGWSAANSVLWQCDASLLICPKPPTAQNWAFGCWGEFSGDGAWAMSNASVKPVSLYYAQLADRGIRDADERADLLTVSSDASSSPSAAEAARLIAESTQPAPQLSDWIDRVGDRHLIPKDLTDAKSIDEIPPLPPPPSVTLQPLTIKNGWLVVGDHLAAGGREEVAWWTGGIRPLDIAKAKPCLTRFVPGRDGPGLTDDLDQLTDSMIQQHTIGIEHHYGLWYDERDDDHERIRRMNGDVWPPFYELPFLRSGQGLEWDGLSKYDLTRYNPWYFNRLKQFATLCDAKGLVLVNQQFFQHNIIEAGAHWASCPWRSANNINDMGFPEPPPYAGDKRIFMAEQWYDTTNAHRCDIYRAYIRKCLDEQAGTTNVIQLTGAEFTGPLHFMQFWIDTIAQWERDTGKHVIVGLSATKDVQDAILSDPVRAPIVSVIDIRYWWYQVDGKPYSPQGGLNMAPRQLERAFPHKASSFAQVFRAVREYRQRFPDKSVMYSADGQGQFGWAALMAGGSLPDIRTRLDPRLLAAIPSMHPVTSKDLPPDLLMLVDANDNYLIYNAGRGHIKLGPTRNYSYMERWINPRTGEMIESKDRVDQNTSEFKSPGNGMNVLWLVHQ
jgi:hypothetical protein